jgi:hypothetical protein
VLNSLLCNDLLCDSTYISLVGVNTPLHNVLVVGTYDTLLVLCLVQILLYLILHLYILVACYTEVLGYTVWGYTVDTHYCATVMQCCTIVTHYCMVVVSSLTEVYIVLSSFMLAPCKYLKLFLSSSPSSYNSYHHDPLTCKNCNMNFSVLSYTFASLGSDMAHVHVS